MTTDPAAYWSTVAQLSVVFGLGFVLEARRSLQRWGEKDAVERATHAVFLVLAGLGIIITLSQSLIILGSPSPTLNGAAGTNYVLIQTAIILIFGPLLDIALRGNIDRVLRVGLYVLTPRRMIRLRRRTIVGLANSRTRVIRALGLVEETEGMRAILTGKEAEAGPDDTSLHSELSEASSRLADLEERCWDELLAAVDNLEVEEAKAEKVRVEFKTALQESLQKNIEELQRAHHLD